MNLFLVDQSQIFMWITECSADLKSVIANWALLATFRTLELPNLARFTVLLQFVILQ